MNIQQIRDMSRPEMERKLQELKKDLFNLRLQHATNQLDNPMRINQVKKDIAKVLTAMREDELKEAAGK